MNGSQEFTRAVGVALPTLTGSAEFRRAIIISDDLVLTLTGAPSGLAGTMSVSLVLFDTEAVVIPPTTGGIQEIPSGSGRYVVNLEMPTVGRYFAVWNSGLTTAYSEVVVTEGQDDSLSVHSIAGSQWPDGTSVGVYPALAWPDPSRAPFGERVATSPVSEGTVTFYGLKTDVRYVAYADGKGIRFSVNRYISEDIASAPPGRRRDELIEAKVSALSRITGASSYTADPILTRLAELEAAVADLQEG